MKKTIKMNTVLLITTIMIALTAGVFFTWSCSVIPGLSHLNNPEYIKAMQSINREIQNPVFFSCFLGAVVMLPVTTYMNYDNQLSLRFWLLLAASVVYIIGVFGVTVGGNVPLNNTLDAFNLSSATIEEIARQRTNFETLWNNLNTIRTIAGIVSMVLILLSCLKNEL